MNALLRYLKSQDESLSAFAVRIGRAPSTLSRVLSGLRSPSVALARDVEQGTEGAITAHEFIAICICSGEASAAPSVGQEAAE